MTAGERSGSLSSIFSIDTLSLSASRRLNSAGTGSASITVQGVGLRLTAFSVASRMGFTACEGTEWESETSLRCLLAMGAKATQQLSVTAGHRSGSLSETISFDAFAVSAVSHLNFPSIGATMTTILGSALSSASPSSSIGPSDAEASIWKSDSSVACKSVSGLRQMYSVLVTSGVRASSTTEVFSFDRPAINNVRSLYGDPAPEKNAVSCTSCIGISCVEVVNDAIGCCRSQEIGIISDGPDNYVDYLKCTWIIQVAQSNIVLKFYEFDTEAKYDFVKVYTTCTSADCSSTDPLDPIDGNTVPSSTYTSSTGIMKIEFTSDGSTVKKGFAATWWVPELKPEGGSVLILARILGRTDRP